MKQIIAFVNRACVSMKHYVAELLVSFEQFPVNVDSIYHSDTFCKDYVVLRIVGKHLTLEVALQELIARSDILAHMHPLEITLIRFLAEEELYKNGQQGRVELRRGGLLGLASLEYFSHIDKQFLCELTHQLMVIVTVPGQDREECLSARDLLNNRELMALLKSYSSYSYQYLASDWSSQQIVVC